MGIGACLGLIMVVVLLAIGPIGWFILLLYLSPVIFTLLGHWAQGSEGKPLQKNLDKTDVVLIIGVLVTITWVLTPGYADHFVRIVRMEAWMYWAGIPIPMLLAWCFLKWSNRQKK